MEQTYPYGVRRQSAAAAALSTAPEVYNLSGAVESGVALTLAAALHVNEDGD